MNDLLINETVMVPIAVPTFFLGISNRLVEENLPFESPFAGYFWNIRHWTLAEGYELRYGAWCRFAVSTSHKATPGRCQGWLR